MDDIIITSMSREGLEQYGAKMLVTFRERLMGNVDLVCFMDCNRDIPQGKDAVGNYWAECIHWKSLESEAPKLKEVLERYPRTGGNYNHDIGRFAPKSFAIIAALRMFKARIYWFDADTVMLKPLPYEKLRETLPDGVFSSYLGRQGYHTEGGFYAFDGIGGWGFLNEDFADGWEAAYMEGVIETLDYRHDCGVYDDFRTKIQALSDGLLDNEVSEFLNLTPDARKAAHCFLDYWMPYIDHLKGPRRKKLGYSPEGRK